MSELADRGLLLQPHTSAGRIPSQKGYRVYVDRLMKRRPLSPEERRTIDSLLLSASYDPQKLLEGVSRLLAGMTRFAAVSTSPGGAGADVRAVQFVQTSRRTAMAILITSAGTMKTRVFHCDFDLTPDILRVFFRTVNERVAGRGVEEITPAFIQGLAASQGEMAILMSSALMAVLDAAQEAMAADVCLHGQMNLLFCPEFEGSGARRVIDFLSREEELTRLILAQGTQGAQAGGPRVLIGRETKRAELANSSVVSCRYGINGRDAGAIAVIGPTRMDYSKMVASIEYLANAVGRMLTELLDQRNLIRRHTERGLAAWQRKKKRKPCSRSRNRPRQRKRQKTAGEPAAQEAEAASAAEAEEAEDTKRKKKQDDDLQQKLEEAVKETQKLKDQLLRTAAEYDNFRKRSDREKKAIYADATADAVSGLLGVADNLERALAQKDCTVEDLRKGIEMVQNEMRSALRKLNVTEMGAVGDAFDPALHNAVAHIEDETLGENVVAQVFQKGYRIGGQGCPPCHGAGGELKRPGFSADSSAASAA